MQAEAQISHDPETVVSIQNGDPGVSSSLENAVMPQQPGQFFALAFLLEYNSIKHQALMLDACVIVEN